VLERGIAPVLAILGSFGPDASRPEPGDVVAQVMARLARHPNLPRLILHETLSGGQRLTPMLREWIAPVFGRASQMVGETRGGARWSAEQVPLLVLAMYHMVIGYFASTSLWTELDGADLLSPPMLARQTELVREIVTALFPDEAQPT